MYLNDWKLLGRKCGIHVEEKQKLYLNGNNLCKSYFMACVEEKQKLYLNGEYNAFDLATDACWRETKVVFK